MTRPYDKNNPRDRVGKSSIYEAASEDIAGILQNLGGAAPFREICNSFKRRYPDLCDENIHEPTSASFPTWRHAIASSLQSLKKRNEVRLVDGLWSLVVGMLTTPRAYSVRPNLVPAAMTTQGFEIVSKPFGSAFDGSMEGDVSETSGQGLESRLIDRVLELSPQGFERLVADFLTKLGFVNVKMTGGPHDRGIDGQYEIVLVGLKLAFQAKRYQAGNLVRAPEIRNFRGAMVAQQQVGGLLITTSKFTDEARLEADSPGPAITLVDGNRLTQIMVERRIGIRDAVVDAEVDDEFFNAL